MDRHYWIHHRVKLYFFYFVNKKLALPKVNLYFYPPLNSNLQDQWEIILFLSFSLYLLLNHIHLNNFKMMMNCNQNQKVYFIKYLYLKAKNFKVCKRFNYLFKKSDILFCLTLIKMNLIKPFSQRQFPPIIKTSSPFFISRFYIYRVKSLLPGHWNLQFLILIS